MDHLDLDELKRIQDTKEIKPVVLKNYSRYQIFPDGRVFDIERNSWVIMNRFLNFVMFADDVKPNDKGKINPELFNIRQLIKDIVDNGSAPGFDKYLPEYNPPEIFSYLSKDNEEGTVELRKELFMLRSEFNIAMENLLQAITRGEEHYSKKERYEELKNALDAFKEQNPLYWKWQHYNSKGAELSSEIQKIDDELEDLKLDLGEIEDRIKAVVLRLNKAYGYNTGILKLREMRLLDVQARGVNNTELWKS